MNKAKILVVEDDKAVRNLITTTLETQNYQYHTAEKGSEALLEAVSFQPDVMLLDLGLPDMDGIAIIEKVRGWSGMPIIVISARSEDSDKVAALDAGADDYVQKPFRMMELLSRIRALLRRAETYGTPAEQVVVYRVGGLEVSPSCHLVKVNGQDIALTLKEFELLCLLLENRGIVLSRDKILDKVWGDTMGRESRTVDVHIKRLREKLEGVSDKWSLKTVWGVGYKFESVE